MIVFDGGTPTPDLPKLSTQCRWSGEGIPGLSCIAQAPEVPSSTAASLCQFPDTDTFEAHASSETATIDLQRYSYDPCAPPGRQARRGYAPLGRFAQSAEQCRNARKHGQAQPARFGAIFEALAGDFEYV